MKHLLAALSCALVLTTGCNSQDRIIDHLTFTPSDNLEVVRVAVFFTSKIKSDLAAGVQLKNYGYLFLNPYTPQQPFEVGFDLDTAIVNDQDYIRLEPTTVLPNGVPMGLDHGLVEVRDPKPISSKFDIYGYVDVLRAQWLGVASIFNFLDNANFPKGLTLSQVLWRDKQGNAGVVGSVFGPSVSGDGTVTRAGGIAIMANVRALIAEHKILAGHTTTLVPGKGEKIELAGPAASYYRQHPKALGRVASRFVEALNRGNGWDSDNSARAELSFPRAQYQAPRSRKSQSPRRPVTGPSAGNTYETSALRLKNGLMRARSHSSRVT